MAKPFWSKVETAGDSFELGVRTFLGFVLAIFIGGAAWALGAYVWLGLAIILVIPAAIFGFLLGFFWVEIKLLFQLAIGAMT